MNNDFAQLADYFSTVTGQHLPLERWEDEHKLPLFLRKQYAYSRTSLFGQHCLLALSQQRMPGLNTLRAHLRTLVNQESGLPVIVVFRTITPQQRFSLIRAGIEFIVPGNQMFLPGLAIDLRETFKSDNQKKENAFFSPATQAIIIRLLNEKYIPLSEINISKLVNSQNNLLPYSAMTVSRAITELESAGLVNTVKKGRIRQTHFIASSRAELWHKARPFLRSPVRDTFLVPLTALTKSLLFNARKSGETALAEAGMLNPPAVKVYAVEKKLRNKLMQYSMQIINGLPVQVTENSEQVRIEAWSYSIALDTENNDSVDHFSLVLSLQDVNDERVQDELEKLEEAVIQ